MLYILDVNSSNCRIYMIVNNRYLPFSFIHVYKRAQYNDCKIVFFLSQTLKSLHDALQLCMITTLKTLTLYSTKDAF